LTHDAGDVPRPPPELIRRAREGDDDARGELVRLAYPLVLRWARVRLGDPDEADDLTNDVLIRVLRKLDTFRDEALFTTWLYRVVRNAALDRSRKRRRTMARLEDLEAARSVPGVERDPLEGAHRERVMTRILECFQALPDRQREVFDLADLQGLSSSEIAERLDLRPSSVRVSLLKARRAIRRKMLEHDPELVEEVT
jgi:RNA polymerase sigma-70 factor (ECF subfamily)